jgi:hypothetical protein
MMETLNLMGILRMAAGREEIHSKAVRAGKRTYFFDVKATRQERLLPDHYRKQEEI